MICASVFSGTFEFPRTLWLGSHGLFSNVEPKGNYTCHLDIESFQWLCLLHILFPLSIS